MTQNKIKFVHTVYQSDSEQLRTRAELNAVTYADRMIEDLNGGINITNSLEQILISENGEIRKFDTVAESMMADYVQSIQSGLPVGSPHHQKNPAWL